MDWQEQGKEDALKGESSGVLAEYTKACNRHGIPLNQENYAKGRAEGLKLFCTYSSGHQYGRQGKSYSGVCPQEMELDFIKGYHIGKKEYEIEQAELELERRKRALEEEEAKLRAREAVLSHFNTRQCSFDSDCDIRGNCSFGKCAKSGASCTFDSECAVRGRCSSEFVCAGSDCDRINMCKYD
ncbi:MAG: DUF2799 domain-containing protein [Bdellovibrionales bacterium]|nr:DUF2799 domain-containing protein [Bdellovibrionales bacterium]